MNNHQFRCLLSGAQRHAAGIATAALLVGGMAAAAHATGVNPITGTPGFSAEPRGVAGNLRSGRGGHGEYFAPRGGRFHRGLDICAPVGSPIYSNDAGTVVYTGWMGDYGRTVIVRQGKDNFTVYARYAHLSRIQVRPGDFVRRGQQIGCTGRTGNADNLPSGEDHLHFEVRLLTINGSETDPAWWLNDTAAFGP